MIKFEHSVFALPFAYSGLFLASDGLPNLKVFLWVTLAMVGFRTLGMSLNRVFDRIIDAKNPRTMNRSLPQRQIALQTVWFYTVLSGIIFELSAYQLNSLCFRLSLIPLVLAFLYPFIKRFTWLSHFVLGIILGIAPYGAWLAAGREFSWVPGCLTLGVACWVAGFDIIYALQDYEFDRSYGLYSVPAVFGVQASLRLTALLHGLSVICWCAAGCFYQLHLVYFIGLLAVTGLLARENWLIYKFGLEKIEEAFLRTNAFVSLILFISIAVDFVF